MPDRERKRVPEHRSDVLKGSLTHVPPAHPRNTEYPSIRQRVSEESEKESRDEATQRGMKEHDNSGWIRREKYSYQCGLLRPQYNSQLQFGDAVSQCLQT